MPSPTQSIHILGLGSIGSFVAHSIRSLPTAPPVTLLAHRPALYQEFASRGWKVGLRITEDGSLQEKGGFNGELLGKTPSKNPIHNLVVAVKAPATVSALEPIKHRLGRHSTICLFQNGMGQIDDLNERIFPDASTRPTYMFGIMRHGIYLRSSTEAILAGANGSASLGIVESDNQESRESQAEFLMDILLRAPFLNCERLQWADLFKVQLFKLAANCVLNPLTAILDVRNGCIKENPELWPLHERLLQEISTVFQSLPELQRLPIDRDLFSLSSLQSVVLDTIEKTAQNSSSMREDLRKGRATEIEYINGWILRRGKELGIPCDTNACLTQLVLAKSQMGSNSGVR
jgi:2-dehydropantoate 2-reductase